MPTGTPTTAAMRKASSVRITVTAKSRSSGPPARPTTSVCRVSSGRGSRMALIQPARTTTSQRMKSASGPMKGTKRRQAFAAMVSALEEHGLDHHALLEDVLLREEVVELLEVGDVARLELAVEHVRRERHFARERAVDGGVALHELACFVGLAAHEFDAACIGRDVALGFVRVLLDELGREAGRAAMPRRHRVAEHVARDDAGFKQARGAVQAADGAGRL